MDKQSLHIGSEISLKDFSLSQLIIAVKNLFDTEGVPGLVKVLVILLEQMLIRSGLECPFCKKTSRESISNDYGTEIVFKKIKKIHKKLQEKRP